MNNKMYFYVNIKFSVVKVGVRDLPTLKYLQYLQIPQVFSYLKSFIRIFISFYFLIHLRILL